MDLSVYFLELLGKYPVLGSLVGAVGIARLIFKPLFTFLHQVVIATPSDKDDLLLGKAEGSKVYKWVVFALDYLASIKLPKK